MTLQYGITPQGWVGKPFQQVLAEIDAGLLGILGKSAGTEPDGTIPLQTKAGQLKTLLTDSISAMWDLIGSVVAQLDPNQATGAGLASICSLTGTVQEQASASTVTETLTGVPGTNVPAGSIVAVAPSGAQFFSTASATIASVGAWATSTSYAIGNRVTANGNVYQCSQITSDGKSASSGTGPSGTGTVTDNHVTWVYLGKGTGAVDVAFQASAAGPIGAAAGVLTQIVTPVYGWNGAYNVNQATPGALLETSAALRQRRELELHSEGGPPVDGIRTAVLNVSVGGVAVTSCAVFQNNTDSTSDGVTPPNVPAGLPPHSVMVLADYPDSTTAANHALDAAIADAIWAAVGGGIATTYGPATGSSAISSTAQDSQGNPQTILWAKPAPVNVYFTANVTYDSTLTSFPATGDAKALIAGGTLASGTSVAGAVPTYGQNFPIGRNVWASAVAAAIFDGATDVVSGAQPLAGVLDVQVFVGTSPNPGSGSSVSITQIQRAVLTSGIVNNTVNLTPAVP